MSTVPPPAIIVTTDNQTVGQSLTLLCEVTTVRGITSRVDIVWSSDITELERMNNVSSTTMDNSLVYTDSYTISQMSTTDDGRVIQCEVVINTSPAMTNNFNATLNVTGKEYNMCLTLCTHDLIIMYFDCSIHFDSIKEVYTAVGHYQLYHVIH